MFVFTNVYRYNEIVIIRVESRDCMGLQTIIKLIVIFCIALIITPIVRKLAVKIGATDKPDKRRVNKVEMPTIGGLAIYIAVFIGIFFLLPIPFDQAFPIFCAATVIVITGVLDDVYELNPKQKLLGIVIAALIIYFYAGIKMDNIDIPFIGMINLSFFSFPITMIWLIGITNAINLIDGLDGLASGVSCIALATMGVIGYFFLGTNNIYVSLMIFALVAAILGFLPYNFFPASIFLGDTGALFLGFMISVLSLQGLKNVTFISVIIPIVILGVPVTDTLYAILRRYLNKQPISSADKMHLHHRLMRLGLNHRQTVLAIYSIALIFSIISLLYPLSNLWGSILLTIGVILGLELFVELIGLVGENRQPLINLIRKLEKKGTSNNKDDKPES